MKVIILMGCSGSGKSTYARALAEKHSKETGLTTYRLCDEKPEGEIGSVVLSADDLTFDEDGTFHPEKLSNAHAQCLGYFLKILNIYDPEDDSNRLVIVDNTNTSMAEVAPYVAMARLYDVELEVDVFIAPWTNCAHRSEHGLTAHKIRQQAKRLEKTLDDWPPYWPELQYKVMTVQRQPNA